MIVDTSALVAVVRDEEAAPRIIAAMEAAGQVSISAGTLLECTIVVDRRRDPVLSSRFEELLLRIRLTVVPVSESQVAIGRQAYRDYGKGSGHPAQLNYGDCFAYALARENGEPLLFVGDDFSHTDLRPA